MEEIKLDEVFQVGRTKLKCVKDHESRGCEVCFFEEICEFPHNFLSRQGIECDSTYRKDHTQVVFIKIEEA